MEDVHSAWRAMSCCSGLQPIALLRSLSSWRPPLGAEPWISSTQSQFAAERKPASGRRAHRTLGAQSAGLTGGAVCSAQHTLRGGCGSEAWQERRGCTAVFACGTWHIRVCARTLKLGPPAGRPLLIHSSPLSPLPPADDAAGCTVRPVQCGGVGGLTHGPCGGEAAEPQAPAGPPFLHRTPAS